MSKYDLTRYKDTVEFLDDSEQRATVFLDRYAMKSEYGTPIEDLPVAMWGRVANAIGRGEAGDLTYATPFFGLLNDFKFVPGGRILSGAGTGTEVTFYNCYVIPVETKNRRRVRHAMAETGEPIEHWDTDDDTGNDSREAIVDTIGVMVDIMTRGGGVGINWSVLRPAGSHLQRINATSSGPIDWMHLASVAVGTVEQGGSRRGAAMFMLDDWHPNVLDFIESKRDLTRITNANISVAVSDEFMRRVESDGVWNFVFPDTSHPAYDTEWDGDIQKWLTNHGGESVKPYGSVRARELWRKLAEAAWDNGEPGVVFLDRYNKESTANGVERIISVNPCGEQGLGPYSVCNLGAMNLAQYVDRHQPSGFDMDSFRRDVKLAVRFLDRVIDENYYFLPENERVQKELRRIGLGVMGLADALILMGKRYGSPEAVEFTEDVFRSMKHAAISASAELAKELGPAPAWNRSMLATPYLDDLNEEDAGAEVYEQVSEHGLRNLFLLTQAPTGTTSILAGVNSGIEPLFALGYWREDRTGKHWVQPRVLDTIGYDGSWSGGYLVTANEVTVEEHIAMQAAAQKYIDSSVSKTINAPNSHTVDDVEKAYTLAYKSGLKGLAYFRDGCGRAQVLSTEAKQDAMVDPETGARYDYLYHDALQVIEHLREDMEAAKPKPFTRPDMLEGATHKVRAGTQTAYVTVNRDNDGRPVEVFVSVGKAGTDLMAMGEAMGRLISIGLQHGETIEDIAAQLDGVGHNGMLNRSLPSAIAAALGSDERRAHQPGSLLQRIESAQAWGPETDEHFFVGTDLAAEGTVDVTAIVKKFAQPGIKSQTVEFVVPMAPAAMDLCPDCGGSSLVREEGCKKCHACGYSAC